MNNRKNNVVVGLVVVVALLILLFGIYFLKERVPGQQMEPYSLLFDQVSTLTVGDPVKVNGVKVGLVEDIRLHQNKVMVKAKLRRGLKIPVDSKISVQNIGLMGERQIGILLGDSPEHHPPGTVIRGSFDAGIAEAMGIAGVVFQETESLVRSVKSVLDSTVGQPEFVTHFNQVLGDAKDLSARLHVMLDNVEPKVNASLDNLEAASGQVRILVEKQDEPVRLLVEDGRIVMTRMKDLLARADTIALQLGQVVDNVNSGKGSLGAILKDEELYVELRRTMGNADSLIRQIKSQGLDVNVDLF